MSLQSRARQALGLMDLTSLNENDSDESVSQLGVSAHTSQGSPAALCVYPQFIQAARQGLKSVGLSLPIATVTNFPDGEALPELAAAETAGAVTLGADEIDVVLPYKALKNGDEFVCRQLVTKCKAAAGGKLLKVIIESGELKTPELIRQASDIAIECGADFIKTSTGKVSVNATLEAARIMLEAIKASGKPVGFKAAGGVRTAEDAAAYLDLADEIMGEGWVSAKTFRFGASGLLGALLQTLGENTANNQTAGY
ncbi:deoxyribose-phosphate aldolase [Leeia sp. TBRC 13508]|uniref:Deoxyribose-phosphate aldolase n=1 Tax=Leeia speluncae TaxID=2884804 RepID=A0ABS8D3A9_9NEIS|nr:deoxyribose-phosphate aldolase [Leeia speluncae]MCB6182665.1 deoxyribose-phosphate aldolase [Leeia speluncae]